MEIALNILLSLVLALVVTTLLVLILDQEEIARHGFSLYFPIVFLFVTAAGLWSQPAGTASFATPVLSQLAAAAVILLTTLVFHPKRSGAMLRLLTSESGALETPEMGAHLRPLREPAALRQYYLGLLFWLLVIAVVLGAAVAYLTRR